MSDDNKTQEQIDAEAAALAEAEADTALFERAQRRADVVAACGIICGDSAEVIRAKMLPVAKAWHTPL